MAMQNGIMELTGIILRLVAYYAIGTCSMSLMYKITHKNFTKLF